MVAGGKGSVTKVVTLAATMDVIVTMAATAVVTVVVTAAAKHRCAW